MINWLLNLVPADYKWSIAVKKVTYFAGKGAVALITYGQVGKYIDGHLTPDQLAQVQTAAGIMAGALLEALHDFLKVKYPDAKWL